MSPPTKVYELTFEESPEYLHARIAAQAMDRQTALDYLSEISLKCASTRCKRMLLERDIPALTPDEELFVSMKDLVEMSAGIRIAFVNRHLPVDEAMKHVADYHYGADFKYFNDVADAQHWLLGAENC